MYDKNDQLLQIINEKNDQFNLHTHKIKFLMIQRKDTMGYTDFIRGKYTNDKSLQICLNEMTYQEKKIY